MSDKKESENSISNKDHSKEDDLEILDHLVGNTRTYWSREDVINFLKKQLGINELKEEFNEHLHGEYLLLEVLLKHLKDHKKVSEDQIKGIDRNEIFEEYNKANDALIEKLDSKAGSARQTVKQSDPFKFCSECGYSGNVRHIVCPECHNSYFKKERTEKKELNNRDIIFTDHLESGLLRLDSGGSKSVPKSEEAIYRTDKEFMEDNPSTEKLPEPICQICYEPMRYNKTTLKWYCLTCCMKGKPKENPPKSFCTLKEQEKCDEEGSMDCLKGNSEGERNNEGVCVHGKHELEKGG